MQRIKNFFRNELKKQLGGNSNPWTAVLRGLRQPTGQAPRATAAYLVFHSMQAELVTATAEQRTDERPIGIAFRNKVASELFAALPPEDKEMYERISKEKHNKELARHADAMIGEASVDPEDQKA